MPKLTSHIAESRSVQISALEPSFHLALNAIPPLILARQMEAEDEYDDDLSQMRDDHGPDAERVLRRLACFVEEGSGEVRECQP